MPNLDYKSLFIEALKKNADSPKWNDGDLILFLLPRKKGVLARGGERGRRGEGEIGVKIQGAQIISRAISIGKAVAATGDKRAESNYGIFPNIIAAAGRIVIPASRRIGWVVIISTDAALLSDKGGINAQIRIALESDRNVRLRNKAKRVLFVVVGISQVIIYDNRCVACGQRIARGNYGQARGIDLAVYPHIVFGKNNAVWRIRVIKRTLPVEYKGTLCVY